MPPNLVILRFYRIFAAETKEIQYERIQKRIADKLLEYRLEEVGAVLIEGPKWCGKTTTAEQKAKSVLYMADPDNQNNYLEMANLKIKMLLKGKNHDSLTNGKSYRKSGMPSDLKWTTRVRKACLSSQNLPCLHLPKNTSHGYRTFRLDYHATYVIMGIRRIYRRS